MTSFIAAGGSGRSTSVIPAVPAASSVTTIAFTGTSLCRVLALWPTGPSPAQPNAFLGSAVTRGIDEVLHACAATREDAELLEVEHPRQANLLCERRRERRRRLGHDACPHPREGLAAQSAQRDHEEKSADAPGQSEVAVDDGGREVQRAVDVDLLVGRRAVGRVGPQW